MKKKIQVMLFFLIMIVLVGIIGSNQVFAADEYSLSIEPISYSPQSNLMQRSVTVPSAVSDFENVQVDKYCYTGETFSLTAIIVPANAYVGKVNWTIEQDETIAKIVSQNGLTVSIKGEKAGTCKIVCTAADGQGAYTTCNLTVLQHAMRIVLSPEELLLEPGDREQIIAMVLPADTTDKTISWSSSNPEVAKVDKDGVVTGVSASLEPVTITCKVLDGSGVEATATVNVRVLVEVIEWQKFSNVIYKKGMYTEKFYTSVLPNHATIPTLKYTSSNPEVASLMADPNDNSCILITPKYPGKFNIICETTDGSNVKLVTEVEVIQLLEYLTLSDTSKILLLQDGVTVTHQLQVKSALPSYANVLNDGIENAFTWSSSDNKVATVDQTGLVTALKPGTVTITATAKDIGATSASCTIYVRKPVTSMEIDLYSYEYIQDSGSMDVNLLEKLKYLNGIAYVYAGDTVALNAAFNTDATLKTVMWQIAGKGTDASGANILGIFAKVSDSYTNPTIMTALPINVDNENGYLNVVITVKATDGSNVTAKRVVQIRQPATSLTINKTTMTLYTPESGEGYATMDKLNVSILPENAYVNKNPDSFSDGSIIWTSDNEAVATVSSEGHVNAVSAGEATIYAKSADGHGEVVSCKVTVLQAIKNIEMYAYQDEQKIEIEHQDYIYAYTNQEIRLFTKITPEAASNQKLTWNSGNPLIATVDNGYLKIGNKPTVTSESSSYVTISCSATDGSGKTLMFYLYVLDSEYNIDVKDFLSITSGSSDKLLLKVSKNDNSSDTPISVPIKSDVTVSLTGNSVVAGNDSYEIIELYDENGRQIKDSVTLSDVTNPSFDIKARYNGVVTVKFNIKPQDVASLPDDCVLVGKTISFERTCTINVTGNDNRTISISQSSLSLLVNETKQVNAVVLPATATNYYIKYGMKGYNDDYANPYEFARINEDTGIVTGFEVGIIVVTATLYDSTTNKIVNTNGIDQVAEIPVYITESLTGVKMEDSFVYVGEEISLLDFVQLTPTALNKTLDKSSAVRFNVVSGGDHIKFSANSFGHIQGVSNGEVIIEAIATYGDAIYTSNQAKIVVKSRLNGISLIGSYGLKLNEMIKLNPTRNPSNGDLSQATITWTSSNTDYVTVTSNKDDGYNGLIGIVTGRKATPSGNPVTVTVTVKTDKNTFTAKTEITVIPLDVDNFSADTTNKLYTLSTDGWQFYRYGAYALKSSGSHYAAGCLENGASALSTVYLYNSGETSWYKGTYKYPSNYPLRTFVALERAEKLVEQAAAAAGITKQDMIDRLDAGLKLATAVMGSDYYDPNAYLDLPNRSHLWVKNGNSYSYNSEGFVKWGHASKNSINIFSGLLHSFDKEASAEQVVSDLANEFLTTHMNSDQTKLAGSYFTSALTSINVLNGSPEVAKRQANAISIIGTYFPLDEVYNNSGATKQYQKLHAARQMLIWSVSGIKVDSTEYNKRKAINADYVCATENYAGSPLYYVCYMLQDGSDDSANFMYYPYTYSTFYYAIKNILAPSRITDYYSNIESIMVIIEGFTWKMDQVKNSTIPSFAQSEAHLAKKEAIPMHYDASKNQYVATVSDENGVLNYFTFSFVDPDNNKSLASFKNNGDGTLTISVPKENVDRIIEIQDNKEKKPEYMPASAAPELIPEDNLYECAAFAKWEMETEISQIPYTKRNGSLGYVYMIGNNVQSQYIDVQNEMIKSNLGDPYEAYIAFSFDNPDTFDSVVESDVKIYDTNGNEVEYIIPNEQYQLKYIFTYTGNSRGLKVVDTNASLTARGSANVYGFAADMRARGSQEGVKDSLIDLSNDAKEKGIKYVTTTTNSTITTPVWALDADKVPVKMRGGYTTYDTGTGLKNTWECEDAWSDNIYIDANVGDKQLFSAQDMVNSSQHPTHVTVKKKDNGDVEITWVFYTAYTTFTTPYVKAYADITIDKDTTHPATKQLNQPNEDTDRYIYGLVIDGKRAVQSYPSAARVNISSYNDYVNNYSLTGMIACAKNIVGQGRIISDDEVVFNLFETVYYKNGGKSLSEYSLEELYNIGSNSSNIGTIQFYQKSGNIVGIIVYIGKHEGLEFCIYWRSANAGGTGKFTGDTWDNGVRAMNGCSLLGERNYETYVYQAAGGTDGEGDDNIGSTSTYNPASDGMTTSFVNSAQWAVPASKVKEFTLTNAETYGGSGYLNADFGYTYANNAQNYTTFHTDKTFMTVFDLSISDLVVNTGAGITSPTSVDTRNFVNLNIYYTINLDNSAYKVITNRWGKIGGIWWHYFKNTNENGQTEKAATVYEYKMKDFFYKDGDERIYCKTATNPKTGAAYPEAGVTYYYDPNHTGNDSLPDSKSANGNIGDFIPDDRQHLVSGNSSYTRPAGWAEEKKLDITIHSDVFTNFYIYDNSDIPASKKLDPAAFSVLSADEQWRTLSNINPTTGVYFIDNIQTGENYIQHTVPYVLTTIESGVKVYGFSAHVNKTQNNGAGVVLSSGDTLKIKNASAEWGEKVGKYINGETSETKPTVNHINSNVNMDVLYQGSSILGYSVSYSQANKSFSQPIKVGLKLYKNYYYESIYNWSYSNNDTATSMLQYPAYNPYTLSIVSSNGSLIYKNKANVTGFDITLGNNQNTHVPNTDNIAYLMYLRKFGANGVNNAVPINGTYSAYYYNGSDSFISNGSVKTNNFVYGSLSFYKYSDSTYYVYNASGANTNPSSTIKVEGVSASTELVNETETETMKFTKILFKSTYTVSRNLGDKGWVDITSGNNPDAIVNAGKGFELKIEVTYTNNNLTDYLSRYLKDSAQVAGKTSSALSGVTSTGCNISTLTGEMGVKSMTDQYTAKVLENKVWNNVFGANLYEDIYVIMNNNNKYVYSYTGVYGSTQVFDLETKYNYESASESGSVVMTYTMKLSPVNGFFGNTSDSSDKTGLATQNMKFYTDASAAGTVGSLTIWTNPIAATPFGYPGNMRDRYLADLAQIQYYIVQPVDNVDNIVQ